MRVVKVTSTILIVVCAIFLIVNLALQGKEIKELAQVNSGVQSYSSDFLKSVQADFESRYSDRFAWARQFGYGKASLSGREVEWFAFCNTDGWLQFLFSGQFSGDQIMVLGAQKDKLNRSWEAVNISEKGWSWLGESNCWINDFAKNSGSRLNPECFESKSVLNTAINSINKTRILNMRVLEYLY
jgi:hypothetical protein